MNKKTIFISFLIVIIFSIISWYSLVFAWIWDNIKIIAKTSNNIFTSSLNLKKIDILFSSKNDLSNYSIKSKCNIFSKLKNSSKNNYLFELKVFDDECDSNNFYLTDSKNKYILSFKLNTISYYDILSKLIDLDDKTLVRIKNNLDKKITNFSIDDNRNILDKKRNLDEMLYNRDIVNYIIEQRKSKYMIPIDNKIMPTKISKLPNSGRPYRADYTDWIHEWWDFDWKIWDNVYAIDDWIIIRIVDEFNFSFFNNIKRWNNLSNLDKMKNLDILRWNQVWLKTIKWDVAFYSHLDNVYSNLKVWDIVKKWQFLWTIWISWIPDKSYDDYHLHLELRKRPDITKKTYDIYDYMSWDWYFKWKSLSYILEKNNSIFE